MTGAKFKCGEFSVDGYLQKGAGLPPDIGTLRGMAILGLTPGAPSCTGKGLSLTVTGTDVPWHIRATSYDQATKIAYGKIPGVTITLTGRTCTADLTGLLHWSHATESGSVSFTAPQTLTAANVTGCASAISDGDTFTLSAHEDFWVIEDITSP